LNGIDLKLFLFDPVAFYLTGNQNEGAHDLLGFPSAGSVWERM
jgi:hypothetical protein